MVSRANLSGRKPYGGVLGRVFKGPSGSVDAGGVNVTGAQNPATKPRRGKGIFDQASSLIEQRRDQIEADRAAKYPTTSPSAGETAYRPGFTDADAARISKDTRRREKRERKETKRQEVFARMQKKHGNRQGPERLRPGVAESSIQRLANRDRPQMSKGLVDPTQVGIEESPGDAYVKPARQAVARQGFAQPDTEPGANKTVGAPRRRGSAASRSRRIIR